MTDFRQLQEWEKAHNLTVAVYQITRNFPEEELQGLTQQIRFACANIPINIAQGCDYDETLDKLSFLQQAREFAIELEYYLLLSYDLNLLDVSDYDHLISSVVEVKQMLEILIEKLQASS